MDSQGPNIPDLYRDYASRTEALLNETQAFPIHWGIAGGAKTSDGIPKDFFRFDADRLKRLIIRAEHMIRCLIIWMAWIYLKSGDISPSVRRFPSSREPMLISLNPAESPEKSPVHPDFAARNLPLYPSTAGAFHVSLHDRESDEPRRTERQQKATHQRTRNDDILPKDRLIERLARLPDLFASIESRAQRLAKVWAIQLKPRIKAYRVEMKNRLDNIPEGKTMPDLSGLERPELKPLKCEEPPPRFLKGAEPEERETLTHLHAIAREAAELFTQRCG